MGGTYAELVVVPDHHEDAAGSGMRAAEALGNRCASLVTAVDDRTADAADAAAAVFKIEREISERSQPVGFRYFTPVSDPAIDGPASKFHKELKADDSTVLVFGLVEQGPTSVRTERLIVDPQQPRDLEVLNMDGLSGDRLVIIANRREAASLAGKAGQPIESAMTILSNYEADAVVVKDSGRGCVVVERRGVNVDVVHVGPHPTRTVWPLGSGDVFAAGFATAWDHGAQVVEAAKVASNSAAWWCGSRRSVLPAAILVGSQVEDLLPGSSAELQVPLESPVVYLAAPFFTLAERWLVETCRDILIDLGATVFSPLHDVGSGGDEVAEQDLRGLEQCDSVLALLDGWDSGTVYEVGWAHRHGLPVVGFLNRTVDDGTKMLVGTGAEVHDDLSSALYRAVWAAQGLELTGARISVP